MLLLTRSKLFINAKQQGSAKMFSVHTVPETLENATVITFHLCLRSKALAEEYHHYHSVTVYEKLRIQNNFRPH